MDKSVGDKPNLGDVFFDLVVLPVVLVTTVVVVAKALIKK